MDEQPTTDLERRLDEKYCRLEAKLEQSIRETAERFDGIDQRFDGVDQRFDGIDQLDVRVTRLEAGRTGG